MRIVYDYPPYKRALKVMWPLWDGRCVCAVDEQGILGGCGFDHVREGKTHTYILGIRPAWAGREIYVAIMRMPVEMGAETVLASCGDNRRSQAVCRQMHGIGLGGGNFKFDKDGILKRAKEIENVT